MKKLTGSIVALVTPFHEDGSVDFARLRELCDWHIANGTDAILALGVVIQGATAHAGYINSEVAKCLAQLGLEFGVPVTYGMITAENLEQAIERSGTKAGNKGVDAALAAIEMANLNKAIR